MKPERAESGIERHGVIPWVGPLLGLIGAILIFFVVSAGAKWALLFTLVIGSAAGLVVLALKGLIRPVLLLGLGFSLIINPTKSFGPLDLTNFGGVHGFFLSLTDLTVICLMAVTAANRADRTDTMTPPAGMLMALGLYLLAMIFSLVNAGNQVLAVAQIFFELKCILLFLFIGFWMSSAHQEKSKFLVPMLIGLGLGILLETGIAVSEYMAWLPPDLSVLGIQVGGYMETLGEFATWRVGGTYRHPNYLAVPMAVLIPVMAAAFLAFQGKMRIFFGLGLLAQIVTLTLTLSRAGMVSAIVATLIFVLLILRNRVGQQLLKRNLAVLMVFTLALAVVLSFYSGPIVRKVFQSDPMNLKSRIELNEMAMEMIVAHPFIGVGINNHTSAGQEFSFFNYYQAAFNLPPVVHNIYLLIASEIGIPGLIAFLAFIFLVLHQSWRALRTNADAIQDLLLVGFAAGILGYLVAEMWGATLRKLEIAYLFWWQAGVVIFLSRASLAKEIPPTETSDD